MRMMEDIEVNSVWVVVDFNVFSDMGNGLSGMAAYTSEAAAKIASKNIKNDPSFVIEIPLKGDKAKERAAIHQEYMKERNNIK